MAAQRGPVQARVAELVLGVQQGLLLLLWPVCEVAEDDLDDFCGFALAYAAWRGGRVKVPGGGGGEIWWMDGQEMK